MVADLLRARGAGKSICPSEVARLVAADAADWRAAMPLVHGAVARLHDRQMVALSWRGADRFPGQGPYRIRRRDEAVAMESR